MLYRLFSVDYVTIVQFIDQLLEMHSSISHYLKTYYFLSNIYPIFF